MSRAGKRTASQRIQLRPKTTGQLPHRAGVSAAYSVKFNMRMLGLPYDCMRCKGPLSGPTACSMHADVQARSGTQSEA